MIRSTDLPAAEDSGRVLHTLSISEVHAALATRSTGLTQAEAEARLRRFGPNTLRESKRQPLILKFLANFTHLMAMLM